MGKVVRYHALVVAAYAGLACLVIYWPLFHATTDLPTLAGTPDHFHFHWSYWWTGHALTTPGLSVYETNFVLFPFSTNLAYHTYAPFWFPLWALLSPVWGTLVAFQAIFIVSLTLTGYTFYLLLRQEKVLPGLALIGGILLMLSYVMVVSVARSTLHYLGFWWLPLQILLWSQIVRQVSHNRKLLGWAVVQGIAFYLMAMTDYQYLLYSVFLLVPYGIKTLIEAPSRRILLRLVGAGMLAVGIMTVLLWFAGPLSYLLDYDTSTLAQVSTAPAFAIKFPEGFFWRYSLETDRVGLGFVLLPLTIATVIASLSVLRSRIHDRRRWFWLALSILPLTIAPGETVDILGLTIATPYYAIHRLMGGLFRSVNRFGVVFTIPALIFVGRTWSIVLTQQARSLNRRWVINPALSVVILLLVMVDGHLYEPIPLEPVMPHYDFYEVMGDEQGPGYDEYVVVEVPTAAGTGESYVGQQYSDLFTQFYGITHHKRMVNGLLARAPVNSWYYLRTDDAMLSWLGQRRLLEPETVTNQLRSRIVEWPIGYIVIHQEMIGFSSTTNQEIIGFFNQLDDLLCPVWVERDAVVYRTASHPDACPTRTPPEIEPGVYRIDLGASGDEMFIGWGWHYAETIAGIPVRWTGDWADLVVGWSSDNPGRFPVAELFLDLPPAAYTLTVTVQSFATERQLSVSVNDVLVGQATVSPETLTPLTFNVPVERVGTGEHLRITFDYDDTAPAGERGLALMVSEIVFSQQ
jgi:hypothetical protein